MATIESIAKRLDDLDQDRGYFTIEDFIFERPIDGESLLEAMQREHPLKIFNPAMLRDLLKE